MSNATKKNVFARGIRAFKEEVMACAEMIDECIHKGTLYIIDSNKYILIFFPVRVLTGFLLDFI